MLMHTVDSRVESGKFVPMQCRLPYQESCVMLQAYYVIKAAQEREELQREGDILDGRIQTAEREVQGLEATLAKLNLVNADMGKSFRYSAPVSLTVSPLTNSVYAKQTPSPPHHMSLQPPVVCSPAHTAS